MNWSARPYRPGRQSSLGVGSLIVRDAPTATMRGVPGNLFVPIDTAEADPARPRQGRRPRRPAARPVAGRASADEVQDGPSCLARKVAWRTRRGGRRVRPGRHHPGRGRRERAHAKATSTVKVWNRGRSAGHWPIPPDCPGRGRARSCARHVHRRVQYFRPRTTY